LLALMTTDSRAIALEPDFIESVEQPGAHDTDGLNPLDPQMSCIVRMASGQEHYIARSYRYVTGVINRHYNPEPKHTHIVDEFKGIIRGIPGCTEYVG
jgi:hypothetical protein